ncbi:E3 ubiquitin-protein ligase At1g63170 isoform X2 [Ziziphus jujuba]|uniref:RING-type E3 ubiquitin transferase n=2 Tax=Ziziphus jujuba TaxID=326968 RepID=A0A6P4AR15_ZIZJJ|nr:E3 ubiquitin-protein ligase At1g63170 isoform X2 [Ziziphus jujuba]KAH7522621.1 hypothetical protein FEM48_Zijuj07G0158200 [Ziziphus jujuba var. spinosa]
MDSSPLLGDSPSRRIIRRTSPPLRRAARLLRRASGRQMMLRQPSVQVRENAAEELEERQRDWAYSKPIVVLDVVWNLALVVVGFVVLGLSMEEKPSVPLRLWVCGYAVQCVVHIGCVVAEYLRRCDVDTEVVESNGDWECGMDSNSGSESDGDDYATDCNEIDTDSSVAKHLESANSMFSFIWWVVGFYWVTADGQNLTSDSPQLYWLSITFLAIDVVVVLLCIIAACVVGIAVCCCLPCIIAILYVITDQVGATEEEIDRLPKFKFQTTGDIQKVNGDIQESCGGIMTECDTDSPIEHALSKEHAECCICLSAYENGMELRELPCLHHFHRACIDKWLRINAICPLCKFNILKPNNQNVSEV